MCLPKILINKFEKRSNVDLLVFICIQILKNVRIEVDGYT